MLLGGTLTELVDWRLIFLINLPVGLALAAGALHVVPADSAHPRWRGLDLRGAVLATLSLGALVFAASQADSAGWASTQTLGLGAAALVGLGAFAALELRTVQPLLAVGRLADRGVGGGSLMMLAVSAVLFGTFLLTSLYMQNVLAAGPLESGLAFLPMAAALAVGVHLGTHVITHGGVRLPLGGALAVTAAECSSSPASTPAAATPATCSPACWSPGSASASRSSPSPSPSRPARPTPRPGCSPASTPPATRSAAHSASRYSPRSGPARSDGGPDAAAALAGGIGDAFLAAGALAAVASVLALAILPSAASFLPKFRLAPPVSVH